MTTLSRVTTTFAQRSLETDEKIRDELRTDLTNLKCSYGRRNLGYSPRFLRLIDLAETIPAPPFFSVSSSEGWSALLIAVFHRETDYCGLLLARGVDPDVTN